MDGAPWSANGDSLKWAGYKFNISPHGSHSLCPQAFHHSGEDQTMCSPASNYCLPTCTCVFVVVVVVCVFFSVHTALAIRAFTRETSNGVTTAPVEIMISFGQCPTKFLATLTFVVKSVNNSTGLPFSLLPLLFICI